MAAISKTRKARRAPASAQRPATARSVPCASASWAWPAGSMLPTQSRALPALSLLQVGLCADRTSSLVGERLCRLCPAAAGGRRRRFLRRAQRAPDARARRGGLLRCRGTGQRPFALWDAVGQQHNMQQSWPQLHVPVPHRASLHPVRVTPMRTEVIIRATRTQNVLGEHADC